MTTVSPKKNHDPARVNEISEKLMENSEIASLISELSSSADDASELFKGLLQVSDASFWYRCSGDSVLSCSG